MFDIEYFVLPLAESAFQTLGDGGRGYTRMYFFGWSAEDILIALLPALAVGIFFAVRNARRERFWRRMIAARSSRQWDA